MPSEEYKKAKDKWLSAKQKYDEAVSLYEAISNLLEHHKNELNIAFAEFSTQQAVRVQELKKANVKAVKGE